jgi:hypothetical protein
MFISQQKKKAELKYIKPARTYRAVPLFVITLYI